MHFDIKNKAPTGAGKCLAFPWVLPTFEPPAHPSPTCFILEVKYELRSSDCLLFQSWMSNGSGTPRWVESAHYMKWEYERRFSASERVDGASEKLNFSSIVFILKGIFKST